MERTPGSKSAKKIERLRNQLYSKVNGQKELHKQKDVCEASRRLDKLIVKYMSHNRERTE